MKHIISYFCITFLLAIIAIPTYIKLPKLVSGYRAYVYCEKGVCDKGYVLNVSEDKNNPSSKVNFLDKQDKTFNC